MAHWGDQWRLTKPAVQSEAGLVAAQHPEAAAVGAAMLRAGGNAVDAALATAFALGVVEPWMSGLGGGGVMQVYDPETRQVHVVDYPMMAPLGLDPLRYPLAGGTDDGLFGWPGVVGGVNQTGPLSVAVPGAVSGFALAAERFGTKPWAELIQPAVALAERGMVVDWVTAQSILVGARELRRFPSSAAVYLPDGLPPVPPAFGAPKPIALGGLARTLRRLAEAGPQDWYQGALARDLLADCAATGVPITAADLGGYRARLAEPLVQPYRGATFHFAPGLTGGPTAARTMASWAAHGLEPPPAAETYRIYAEGLVEAYRYRLAHMGHAAPVSCTTHLAVIDRRGMMVALNNTLLSRFGSSLVLPETGVLMNNGVMWFDPRPGRPNSLVPGARPLSNMSPLIATCDGQGWFAMGAAGGRSIVPAVVQLASFLVDFGMDLDHAFHTPRLDLTRGTMVTADSRLPESVIAALRAHWPVEVKVPTVYPGGFAVPTAVLRRPDGRHEAAASVHSPWAAVAAE